MVVASSLTLPLAHPLRVTSLRQRFYYCVSCPTDAARHKATPGALAERNPIKKGAAWGASDKHGVFKGDSTPGGSYHRSAGDVFGALMGKKREEKHHEDAFHLFMAWAFGLLFLMFFLLVIGA